MGQRVGWEEGVSNENYYRIVYVQDICFKKRVTWRDVVARNLQQEILTQRSQASIQKIPRSIGVNTRSPPQRPLEAGRRKDLFSVRLWHCVGAGDPHKKVPDQP